MIITKEWLQKEIQYALGMYNFELEKNTDKSSEMMDYFIGQKVAYERVLNQLEK